MPVNETFTPGSSEIRRPWGRLLVLVVPFAILGLWLKALRIERFFPAASVGEFSLKLASDVAFGLFWGLLWAMLLLYFAKWRRGVGYVAQALTGALGVYQVVNHAFMMRTGQPLTLKQIVLAFEEAEALKGLLGSQIDSTTVGLLIGVVTWTLIAPPLLGRATARLLRKGASARIKRLSLAAVVALLVAATWSAPTASAGFSLAPPVQLAVAPVREAIAYPERLAPTEPLPDPTTTHLVPRAGAEQRNLVFINLESQRDVSTLPPTKQPVTPVLDALEAISVRPERGYAVLPHTSKALVAIHCGLMPPPDSDNSEADEGGLPQRCLPELLAEQGYETGFFQSATEHFERRRATVANMGFDYFLPVNQMDETGFRKAGYFGFEDDIMLEPLRDWLATTGDAPFYASMLTVTAHHNYTVEGLELIDFVDRPLLNEYLNAVHVQDQFLGNVIDLFKELGLYEDTVFVITGDHGEGFGEHQRYQHDNTIYEEGLRVPLLIHDPRLAPELIDQPVNQLALLPTAVDALGFDLAGEVQYRPSMLSGEPQGLLIGTCWARGRCTAVIDGDQKLIHHFGDRRDEVYNVVTDNYERADVVTTTDQAWLDETRDAALAEYIWAERWYDQGE